MPRIARGFDTIAAARHLARQDRKLGAWMRRIGVIEPDHRWRKPFDPVDALARAILYQQLSGKAAATIVGRVEAAVDSSRLHAAALDTCDDAALRGCGVSGNKLLALRDLSEREARGEIPSLRKMAFMDNEAIIAALMPTRGIGRWTVEMLLMSRLGRADVLPVDDLGIRKGTQTVEGLDAAPTPSELLEIGQRWGPYRTCASFYLWRIADAVTAASRAGAANATIRRSQD